METCDMGIAGKRTVTLEVKIPSGAMCRNCKAKSTAFGGYVCLLYGKRLITHDYEAKEKGVFGRRKWKTAAHKCEECRNGSRESAIGAVKAVSME